MAEPQRSSVDEFSLLKGGPFYRALIQARLMRSDLTLAGRRAAVLAAIAWLPLLCITAIEGHAIDALDQVPFLFDFSAYARYLIAIPLLMTAEPLTEGRVTLVVRSFVEDGLVRKKDHPAFDTVLRQVEALRNSHIAEAVMVLLIIVVGWLLRLSAETTGWRMIDTPTGAARSVAGWWELLVSIPIFQFLLLRWLWRYFIWCWFLWRLSRIELRLFPTHPDRAGGLGILGLAQNTYTSPVFAFSVILAAIGGQELYYGAATFADYQYLLLGYVILVLAVFLGPLYVFTGQLLAARTKGILQYGGLAQEYVWLFHRKWIKRELGDTEPILGSSDIQSLADLDSSFEIVRTMRIAPATELMVNVLPFVIAALAPFAPWILLLVPIDEVASFLLGVV